MSINEKSDTDTRNHSTRSLLERRERSLGIDLSLSYDKPLHLVRGEDVWLYDAEGRAYLDAYNNVAHVGHCHPRVVAAISRQAGRLNTNTRYLHATVLELSEYLTEKLPSGLDVCFFVNSGSEANDIAWQMAKAYTGNSGLLTLDRAYHGITEASFAMSVSEYDPANRPPHVATLETPDTYRGRLRGNASQVGEDYAESCDAAIASLVERGHRPAAFIVDSGTSSAGILDMPSGYLPAVAKKLRAAGGLFIADEVQVGIGRSGHHYWGFESQSVVPDIVTIGKPIGNGHPIGVVVTTRQILAKFNRYLPFFSTFGGNPVSAAAGLEVLRIVDQDELQTQALKVSEYLKQGIRALAECEAIVGEVRGSGLLIGIDLVVDRASREAAGDAAGRIVNSMREAGVLIGRAGPHANVLKIRPPMTFTKTHADQLLKTLSQIARLNRE